MKAKPQPVHHLPDIDSRQYPGMRRQIAVHVIIEPA